MPNFLVYAVAIYLIAIASTYLVVFQRLLRVVLQQPRYEIVPSEDFPEGFRDLYDRPIASLELLGFEFCAYLQVKPTLPLSKSPLWQVLLYHRDRQTYATVNIHQFVEPVNPFDIEFYIYFEDGTSVLTMNGKAYGLIGELPETEVWDFYAAGLEEQWQQYCEQLQTLGDRRPLVLSPEAFLSKLEERAAAYLQRNLERQQFLPIPESDRVQLSWPLAWKTAVNIKHGTNKTAPMLKLRQAKIAADPALAVEIPIAVEVESFLRMQQVEQGSVKRGLGLWLLVGTAIFFLASFAPFFRPVSLAILAIVILFHELGHWLAMRLCGYGDTSIFFIPFFGAAATGRKENASVTEQFIVLLAGPLPGLLLGLGLLAFTISTFAAGSLYGGLFEPTDWEWLNEGILILITLNFINLLPIYPLDGGKIADLLLFSRYPFTDVVFKIVAIAAFVFLAQGSPLTIFLAVVVGATIPNSYRSAQLVSKLRQDLRENPTHDSQELLQRIFLAIRRSDLQKLPFARRYTLAKTTLQRCRDVRSRRIVRLGLGILYLLFLVGLPTTAIASYVAMFMPNSATLQQRREQAERRRKLERTQAIARANRILQSHPQDRKAYCDRALAKLQGKDYPGARYDYTRAIQLNPQDPDPYLRRGQVSLQMKEYKAALNDFNTALRLNPEDQSIYASRSEARRMLGDIKGAEADKSQYKLSSILEASILEEGEGEEKSEDKAENSPSNLAKSNVKKTDLERYKEFRTRQYQAALKAIAVALQHHPQDRKLYFDRARLHNTEQKYPPAIADYNRAQQLLPDDPDLYLQRAPLYLAMKNYPHAIADADRAIQLEPNHLGAYSLRMGIRRTSGDKDGARQDMKKIQELNRKF